MKGIPRKGIIIKQIDVLVIEVKFKWEINILQRPPQWLLLSASCLQTVVIKTKVQSVHKTLMFGKILD